MTTLLFDKTPFLVGDKRVAQAVGKPIKIDTWLASMDATNKLGLSGRDYAKAMRREQIRTNVTFTDDAGKPIVVDDTALHQVPRCYAVALLALVDDNDDAVVGKVVNKGDGVTTPILYQLGTPINGAGGKTIKALEFMAATLGEVEDVLLESVDIRAAYILTTTVATPVSADVTLQRLPSWATAQISVREIKNIADTVLPSFLE